MLLAALVAALVASVPANATAEAPATSRTLQARKAVGAGADRSMRNDRPPRRLMRELRRGGAPRVIARTAAYDPRITTVCRRVGGDGVGIDIAQGATAGARIGETVYVRLWLYDGATAQWAESTAWSWFTAPSQWTWQPGMIRITSHRSVAPAIQTWSASRGYEWSWSRPDLGRDYWCDY
jgi:hypothetical protein